MNKKQLQEMLNDTKEKMQVIVDTAKAENRPFSDEETKQFGDFEAEAVRIQKTIDAMDTIDKAKTVQIVKPEPALSAEEKDIKNFAAYVRANISGDVRQGDSNITKGDNGAIIPKTIANQVIKAVSDISPIFARSKKYNVKGTLSVPTVTAANNGIAMDFASEFSDLESVSAQFTSVDLTGFLAGVLVKVSNSLINNSDINIVNEITGLMADAVAKFFENQLLNGSANIDGIKNATNVTNAASKTDITADELIAVQDSIKSAFQRDACWIMAPATLTYLRQLRYGGTGEYILNPDLRTGFGATLLGKPVFTSDQAPAIGQGAKAIVYADFRNALAVKLVEQFELQVLREKYATQHATGFVGWTEFDAKIINDQAIAVLKMKA